MADTVVVLTSDRVHKQINKSRIRHRHRKIDTIPQDKITERKSVPGKTRSQIGNKSNTISHRAGSSRTGIARGKADGFSTKTRPSIRYGQKKHSTQKSSPTKTSRKLSTTNYSMPRRNVSVVSDNTTVTDSSIPKKDQDTVLSRVSPVTNGSNNITSNPYQKNGVGPQPSRKVLSKTADIPQPKKRDNMDFNKTKSSPDSPIEWGLSQCPISHWNDDESDLIDTKTNVSDTSTNIPVIDKIVSCTSRPSRRNKIKNASPAKNQNDTPKVPNTVSQETQYIYTCSNSECLVGEIESDEDRGIMSVIEQYNWIDTVVDYHTVSALVCILCSLNSADVRVKNGLMWVTNHIKEVDWVLTEQLRNINQARKNGENIDKDCKNRVMSIKSFLIRVRKLPVHAWDSNWYLKMYMEESFKFGIINIDVIVKLLMDDQTDNQDPIHNRKIVYFYLLWTSLQLTDPRDKATWRQSDLFSNAGWLISSSSEIMRLFDIEPDLLLEQKSVIKQLVFILNGIFKYCVGCTVQADGDLYIKSEPEPNYMYRDHEMIVV